MEDNDMTDDLLNTFLEKAAPETPNAMLAARIHAIPLGYNQSIQTGHETALYYLMTAAALVVGVLIGQFTNISGGAAYNDLYTASPYGAGLTSMLSQIFFTS